MQQEFLMESLFIPLLAISGSVFAQDISGNSPTTTLMSATSQGTIDQPWVVSTAPSSSEPTRPSQPSMVSQPSAPTQVSAPLPAIAPLSPDQPQTPSLPLSALQPQQPHQPTPTSSPMEPQQPTPSAPLPTPVIVNGADGTGPSSRNSAQAFATRTFESMQNVSTTLSNLIKVKSY